MNRKFLFLFVLLILVLSTLACGLLGGKETTQPTPAETSEPAAAAPTAPPEPTTPPEPTIPPEPPPAPAAELGEEQRSDHGGFAFQAVSGYTVREAFGFASMEAPDTDMKIGPAILLMGGVTEGGTTSEHLFGVFMNDLESGIQVSGPSKITVGGVPGLAADVSGEAGGKEIVGRVVFVAVTPTQSFNLFGVAPSERWADELLPLFDAVLASVSFFEPSVTEEVVTEDVLVDQSEAGAGGEIRQWASSAAASSEYGNPQWSAEQATGAPDTPDCGDSITAWAAANKDTVEWLELGYDVPVHPTQVNVIQSNTPDQVLSVDLLDTQGEYHGIYSGEPEGKVECPYALSIPVGDADYMAVGVQITIDQSVIPAPWNEIDAVELVGYASAADVPVAAAPTSEPAVTPEPDQPALVWTSYTQYSTDNGLAKDHILSVAVSPDGMAWFGTDGYGLSTFDGQDWTTYTEQDGLAEDHVSSLAVTADGVMWIGTGGMGVSRFDGQNWTGYTGQDGLPNDNIMSLTVAPDGSVWAGTAGGVSHFDGQKWTSYTTQDGLAHRIVQAIAVAPDGTVWAGTNGGVSRLDGQQWTSYTTEDGLINDRVQSIAVASDGSVWIGTIDGASHFIDPTGSTGEGPAWISYPESDDGLAQKLVTSILEDRDGSLWFGVSSGLSHLTDPADSTGDGQSWTTFAGRDGSPGNAIDLALAPDGSLWVGTAIGAYHYAPAE